MPFTSQERFEQGAQFGGGIGDAFAKAMQLVVARRFEELDRQRESDASKEMAASYFEFTGDRENAEKVRGFKGPFDPRFAPLLIQRAESDRQMRDAAEMARGERTRAADQARSLVGGAGFPGAAAGIPGELDPSLVGPALNAAMSLRIARERERGESARASAKAKDAGGFDWETRNRAGTASKRTYDEFDAFLQSTDPASRKAFALIGGVDPDDINDYIGEGASQKLPALPTGSILAALSGVAKQPGSGRARLDEILGSIKDGGERGRVRASLIFARNLARQYQVSQDALSRFDEGLGGLPGPFALPADEGPDLFPPGGMPALPATSAGGGLPIVPGPFTSPEAIPRGFGRR